jgi:hypothetical protein
MIFVLKFSVVSITRVFFISIVKRKHCSADLLDSYNLVLFCTLMNITKFPRDVSQIIVFDFMFYLLFMFSSCVCCRTSTLVMLRARRPAGCVDTTQVREITSQLSGSIGSDSNQERFIVFTPRSPIIGQCP